MGIRIVIMNIKNTPLPVKRTLKKLGRDLQDARKRRRISQQLAAQRAGISRTTLIKIEKGDGGVSLESYAKVLFILGFIEKLADIADVVTDELGLGLETEQLPKRIRLPKKERGEGNHE